MITVYTKLPPGQARRFTAIAERCSLTMEQAVRESVVLWTRAVEAELSAAGRDGDWLAAKISIVARSRGRRKAGQV